MIKIVTMCRQGLVRSVALADVLKLHFRPVDVIPIGYQGNTMETRIMMFDWADHIIVMEGQYMKHVPEEYKHKTFICEVGADTYGHSHNRQLIDKVWNWCRTKVDQLEIEEHKDVL